MGRDKLADVNMGMQGIWKGDERLLLRDLRLQYAIDAQSELEHWPRGTDETA